MQNGLRAKADRLEDLIATQKNCLPKKKEGSSDYMTGLYNGLVLAHSIYIPGRPQYIIPPSKKNKIRYKGKR